MVQLEEGLAYVPGGPGFNSQYSHAGGVQLKVQLLVGGGSEIQGGAKKTPQTIHRQSSKQKQGKKMGWREYCCIWEVTVEQRWAWEGVLGRG